MVRRDVEGLRGIAVLAVMVFHLNPALLPGGFVGVDVFFVISGFLLTAILLEKKEKAGITSEVIIGFYAARVRRIVPAYYAMLVITALAAAILFIPADFDTFLESFTSAGAFRSNQFFSSYGDYFAPESHEQPLLHTWSLALELQFYLLVPLLILVPSRKQLPWILGLILLLATLAAEYRLRILGSEELVYYSLTARIPEFLAGSLAAWYLASDLVVTRRGNQFLRYAGGCLILAAVYAQPMLGLFPGVAGMVPVIGAISILLAKPYKGGVLESAPLVWVGGMSYSLYLWHWPVLAFLRYINGHSAVGAGEALVFVAITFALSFISFNLIENPFRKLTKRRVNLLGYGFVAIAALTSPAAFGFLNDRLAAPPLPVEQSRYAAPAEICHGKVVGDCVRGLRSNGTRVLVLGDSHGAMLNHFFDVMGQELNFSAVVITSSNCVTIPTFDASRLRSRLRKACENQIAIAEGHITEAAYIFLAGKWNWQIAKNEGFMEAVKAFVGGNKEKKIFLMPQVPKLKRDISRIRRMKEIGLPINSVIDTTSQKANEGMRKLAAENTNVFYVPTDGLDFFKTAPVFDNKIIYFDESHINKVGSLFYAEKAEDVFREYVLTELR